MKLKTRISFFIIITIVIVSFAVGYISFNYSKDLVDNQIELSQSSIIENVTWVINYTIDYEKKLKVPTGMPFEPASEEGLETIKNQLESYLKQTKVDEYFIINSRGEVILFPHKPYQNVVEVSDADGKYFFVDIIDEKIGTATFTETIQDRRGEVNELKIVNFNYYEDLDWIFGVITPGHIYYQPLDKISSSLINLSIILVIVFVVIFFIFMKFFFDKDIEKLHVLLKQIHYNELNREVNIEANELNFLKEDILKLHKKLNKEIDDIKLTENHINDFLSKFAEVLTRVSQGDLTKILKVKDNDDINSMGKLFNNAIIRFSKLISKITGTSKLLTESTYELQVALNQLNSVMKRQNEKITEISSAINETTASISDIANNSKNAQQISSVAKEKAKEGGISVQQAIEGMEKIQDRVMEISRSISQLGDSGEQIGKIVGAITQISDQTSLLALNAAIEAARAGEQGRGFAVVADEVGKLAKRVAESAKEIQELIEAIQQQTEVAVKGMQRGMEEVAYGTDLVQRTGQSLTEIISVVDKTDRIIEEISGTVNEQAVVTDNIAQGANKIIENTREVNVSINESVNRINNLFVNMKELQSLIEEFMIMDEKDLNTLIEQGLMIEVSQNSSSNNSDSDSDDNSIVDVDKKKGIKLANI